VIRAKTRRCSPPPAVSRGGGERPKVEEEALESYGSISASPFS